MKTLVSIPDPLFESAEALAARLKLSRDDLYAQAVRDFLLAHGPQTVTRQLNEVYASQASSIPKEALAAQAALLDDEGW